MEEQCLRRVHPSSPAPSPSPTSPYLRGIPTHPAPLPSTSSAPHCTCRHSRNLQILSEQPPNCTHPHYPRWTSGRNSAPSPFSAMAHTHPRSHSASPLRTHTHGKLSPTAEEEEEAEGQTGSGGMSGGRPSCCPNLSPEPSPDPHSLQVSSPSPSLPPPNPSLPSPSVPREEDVWKRTDSPLLLLFPEYSSALFLVLLSVISYVRKSGVSESKLGFPLRGCGWRSTALLLLLFLSPLPQPTESCSTRPSPKPRPIRPYWQPDIGLPKRNCSSDYEALYCLNNGTCYMQENLHRVPTPFCDCVGSYYGKRCEYQEFIDTYLPTIQRRRIETAAISASVAFLVAVVAFIVLSVYVYRKRLQYPKGTMDDYDVPDCLPDRPFSIRRNNQLRPIRRPLREAETLQQSWEEKSAERGAERPSEPSPSRSISTDPADTRVQTVVEVAESRTSAV